MAEEPQAPEGLTPTDHWTPLGHHFPVAYPQTGRPRTWPCTRCGLRYEAVYAQECSGPQEGMALVLVLRALPDSERLRVVGDLAPEVVDLLRDVHAGLRAGLPGIDAEDPVLAQNSALIDRLAVALKHLDPK